MFRTLMTLLLSVGVAYLLLREMYTAAAALGVVTFIFLFSWFRRYLWVMEQIQEFSEAVKYRDFTRRYVVKSTQTVEGLLFDSFNKVNDAFKEISAKREIQHQYLSKVVNMLDSAILFYQAETGKVEWVNDAFKRLFEMPHLGNIRGLRKRRQDLYEKTLNLDVGQQQIETTVSSKGKIKLILQVSQFETESGTFRIVVFQNVQDALDETETKAYQRLLRVLTHEIMNSIGPIASISATLNDRLELYQDKEELEDVLLGVHTIKRRSEGLLKFAKSYRLINKVDTPQYREVSVLQLLENIYHLLEPSFLQKNIDVDIILKNTRMTIHADLHLIEQVLINLMLNAIEAVRDREGAYISMAGLEENGRVQLKISDNGMGMEADLQEEIFTPFFTTKKTGSGIGLTLSKQIMLIHKGNIFVKSELGKGSIFTLQF